MSAKKDVSMQVYVSRHRLFLQSFPSHLFLFFVIENTMAFLFHRFRGIEQFSFFQIAFFSFLDKDHVIENVFILKFQCKSSRAFVNLFIFI